MGKLSKFWAAEAYDKKLADYERKHYETLAKFRKNGTRISLNYDPPIPNQLELESIKAREVFKKEKALKKSKDDTNEVLVYILKWIVIIAAIIYVYSLVK